MSELHSIYLRLAAIDIALVKFLFESYEEVAVLRTIDRHAAVIVVLVCPDYLPVARGILEDLHTRIAMEEIPRPFEDSDDWMMRLLDEG
jgi:Domain of unknown function (DUF4911)